MLVLSRKVGEAIVIGDQVVIKVAAVYGRHVRLAISAPPHVLVLREELVDNTSAVGPEASGPPGSPPG